MNFLYARVSSVSQNLDRQVQDMNSYDRVYEDKCSGKNTDRPQLQAMLSNLRPGDTVTCHSLDRLARNTFDLLDLVKQITADGCTVKFIKENLTFESGKENPISELMLNILGSIAQFERQLIKTRQMEGIAIAKEKKKFKGGSEKLSDTDSKELKQLLLAHRITVKEAMKKYNICRASVYNYKQRAKTPEETERLMGTANNLFPNQI